MKLLLKRLCYALLALFVLIQFAPYGRDHSAPPGDTEPKWDSPRTREFALRACFDCHSNQTHWPWYSWVAPISWLVLNDVKEGRQKLNFSQFDRRQRNAEECADQVRSGEMPMPKYTWLHPSAKLSAAEREELADSFEKMFGG